MDLTIFFIFLIVSFILFIAGELVDVNIHVLGFMVIFLAGIIILTGNLEYNDGVTITKNFTYLPDNSTIDLIYETQTPVKTTFEDSYQHYLGWGLSVIGVMGTAFVYLNFYRRRDDDGEE